MRTSAARETRETATATVHGSVRSRNGSEARLSLAITCSFAFRRDGGAGGAVGRRHRRLKDNPRRAGHATAPRSHLHAPRAARLQKSVGLLSARLAGRGAAVLQLWRRDAVGDDAVAPHVLGAVEG